MLSANIAEIIRDPIRNIPYREQEETPPATTKLQVMQHLQKRKDQSDKELLERKKKKIFSPFGPCSFSSDPNPFEVICGWEKGNDSKTDIEFRLWMPFVKPSA